MPMLETGRDFDDISDTQQQGGGNGLSPEAAQRMMSALGLTPDPTPTPTELDQLLGDVEEAAGAEPSEDVTVADWLASAQTPKDTTQAKVSPEVFALREQMAAQAETIKTQAVWQQQMYAEVNKTLGQLAEAIVSSRPKQAATPLPEVAELLGDKATDVDKAFLKAIDTRHTATDSRMGKLEGLVNRLADGVTRLVEQGGSAQRDAQVAAVMSRVDESNRPAVREMLNDVMVARGVTAEQALEVLQRRLPAAVRRARARAPGQPAKVLDLHGQGGGAPASFADALSRVDLRGETLDSIAAKADKFDALIGGGRR